MSPRVRAYQGVILALGILVGGCQTTSPDGILDCTTDVTFVEEAMGEEGTVGLPRDEAIASVSNRYPDLVQNGLVQVDAETYVALEGETEVLVIRLMRLPNGNFVVDAVRGCG